jgi:hypothetical protein
MDTLTPSTVRVDRPCSRASPPQCTRCRRSKCRPGGTQSALGGAKTGGFATGGISSGLGGTWNGSSGGYTFTSTAPTSASKSYTCAIIGAAAACWGTNSDYQVSGGSFVARPSPTPLFAGDVSAIATGEMHACAVVNGGALCRGEDFSGQLGDGNIARGAPAVQVQGLTAGVSALSAGQYHTCAIVNGAALCWGSNFFGQLGNNGNTTISMTPAPVSGLTAGVTAMLVASPTRARWSTAPHNAGGRARVGSSVTAKSSTIC